jgi:hypothetical protein
MCRLLKVRGQSLYPDYKDGDFVFISKIPIFFGQLRPGAVIAFRHPDYGTLIKRVERIEPGGGSVFVIGNHPDSVDSRKFGPVPIAYILGQEFLHVRKPQERGS